MTSNPLTTMTVTSPFGPRKAPTAGGSTNHQGTDLRASVGTAVHAIKAGTVTVVASNAARGLYVIINHGGGIETLYQHLSAALVHVGESVSDGETIAKTGKSGNVTGPHLHVEVHVNRSPIDPMPWLAAHVGKDDAPRGVLREGSTGPRVTALQAGLRRVFPAYASSVTVKRGQLITVDGSFGPQTEAWVVEFQRRTGIAKDGIVGPITTARLAGYGITL